MAEHKRQWRNYRTAAGGDPVGSFLDHLTDEEAAQVAAAMRDIRSNGLAVAKHLRGDVYEVIADSPTRSFRILFATEGRRTLQPGPPGGGCICQEDSEDAGAHARSRGQAARRLAKKRQKASSSRVRLDRSAVLASLSVDAMASAHYS